VRVSSLLSSLKAFYARGQGPPATHEPPFNRANRSLPEANKWALSEFITQALVPIVGVHPYPIDEQMLICSTVAYFQPDVIIEWGTHKGCSARIFHETTRFLGIPAEIHSIDLPASATHEENLTEATNRAHLVRGLTVTLHEGDGLSVARELCAAIKPPKTALFFLDGDHAYESVRRELSGVRGLVASAAVLVHDSFNQGPESGYNVGPYRALSEFAAAESLPVHSTVLGLPGMSLTYW
jgi:cephalosporin hydroxylase